MVKEECEEQDAIDPNQNELEHGCHEKLILVDCDSLDDVGQRGETVDDIQELHAVEYRTLEETQKGQARIDNQEHNLAIA